MTKGYFVTGIGTGVGKTVVSSMLVSALGADYWKPTQSGHLSDSDSERVVKLCGKVFSPKIHPEAYRFTQPLSPHAAAAEDNVQVDLSLLSLPRSERSIIVEGAGGCMVPITPSYLMIDLIQKLGLPTIVVSKNYLGSINHTLLTLEALYARHIPIAGVVFNGNENTSTQEVIKSYSGMRILGRVPEADPLTPLFIHEQGQRLIQRL